MNPKMMTLGDRMKEYEKVADAYLIHRMPIIARVDGRAFHSFCKGMEKPYDNLFIALMNSVASYLRENVPDCKIAYVESDEITLCLFPYETFTTVPFFDGRTQKLASVIASMATWKFNKVLNDWANEPLCDIENMPANYPEIAEKRAWATKYINRMAMFDCRVWNLPREEVLNCLLWRQHDSKRNAILTAGQTWIGKKKIDGMKTTEIIDKLKEMGIDYWKEIPAYYHYGRTFIPDNSRTKWRFDDSVDKMTLERFINIDNEE